MKIELGRCLLQECLIEHGVTIDELVRKLRCKPEKISDFIENKRIMPLKVALSIADTIGCEVRDLYEII